jgi:hypothetical protein
VRDECRGGALLGLFESGALLAKLFLVAGYRADPDVVDELGGRVVDCFDGELSAHAELAAVVDAGAECVGGGDE